MSIYQSVEQEGQNVLVAKFCFVFKGWKVRMVDVLEIFCVQFLFCVSSRRSFEKVDAAFKGPVRNCWHETE